MDWWAYAAGAYVGLIAGGLIIAHAYAWRAQRHARSRRKLEELIVEEFRRDTLSRL